MGGGGGVVDNFGASALALVITILLLEIASLIHRATEESS